MIDSLVQFLLEEIAMDGDAGQSHTLRTVDSLRPGTRGTVLQRGRFLIGSQEGGHCGRGANTTWAGSA
jgi:hypothetical protein